MKEKADKDIDSEDEFSIDCMQDRARKGNSHSNFLLLLWFITSLSRPNTVVSRI